MTGGCIDSVDALPSLNCVRLSSLQEHDKPGLLEVMISR